MRNSISTRFTRKWGSLMMVIIFFGVYFLTSFIGYKLTNDSVLSTVISDCIIILFAGSYVYSRNEKIEDKKAGLSFYLYIILLLLFVFVLMQTIFLWKPIAQEMSPDIARHPVLYMIVALLLAPLSEEILMRGMVFHEVYRKFGRMPAYVISILVFSFLHSTIQQILSALFCGFLFGFVYEKTNKLRYSVFAHGVFNIFSVIFAGTAVSDVWIKLANFPFVTILGFATITLLVLGYYKAKPDLAFGSDLMEEYIDRKYDK